MHQGLRQAAEGGAGDRGTGSSHGSAVRRVLYAATRTTLTAFGWICIFVVWTGEFTAWYMGVLSNHTTLHSSVH